MSFKSDYTLFVGDKRRLVQLVVAEPTVDTSHPRRVVEQGHGEANLRLERLAERLAGRLPVVVVDEDDLDVEILFILPGGELVVHRTDELNAATSATGEQVHETRSRAAQIVQPMHVAITVREFQIC